MQISITNELRQIDEALFEHLKRFRSRDFLIPTNREKERAAFFQARQKRQTYNPVFKYKKNDEILEKIKAGISSLHLKDHPLEKIYEEIIQQKLMIIELIETRDPILFSKYSEKMFHIPSVELVQEALSILKRYKVEEDTGVFFGIKLLSEKIRERLAADHIEGWSITETPENIWIAEADHINKKILLQQGIIVNETMTIHLLRRCIEVSIFRSKNAERQPLRIFELGLFEHQETELGLALEMSIGFGLFHPRFLTRAAAGVLAANLAFSHSFAETFDLLLKYFPEDTAYNLCEKVKMGLVETKEKGGFINEHLPLQGRKKIRTLSNQDIYFLYTGNVSHHHLPLIRDMIEQNILFEPAFVPHFLYEK